MFHFQKLSYAQFIFGESTSIADNRLKWHCFLLKFSVKKNLSNDHQFVQIMHEIKVEDPLAMCWVKLHYMWHC